MDNYIKIGRQNMQQQLVSRTPAGPATSSPTYIVQQSQQVAPAAPTKKKNTAKRSELQASSFYRLNNVPGP